MIKIAKPLFVWIAALVVVPTLTPCGLRAATRYVNAGSTNAVPPFTDWSTAATLIQQAVSISSPGDEIVVASGVYATGTKVAGGATNRLAIDLPIVVRSASGPEATVIEGQQHLEGSNVVGGVRGVYLSSGASLIGFTVRNGAADFGGGVFCQSTGATVSNCVISNNYAQVRGGGIYLGAVDATHIANNVAAADGGGVAFSIVGGSTLADNASTNEGGGAYKAELLNCTIEGNTAARGGGLTGGAATNSVFRLNTAGWGGGVNWATLHRCVVGENHAENGGGVGGGKLSYCVVTNNSCHLQGGGCYDAEIRNTTVASNSAGFQGGGACYGRLENSVIYRNVATKDGGGVAHAIVNNCSIADNASGEEGGGVYKCAVTNSIVYFNASSTFPNHAFGEVDHTCTTPIPDAGAGNTDRDPLFADLTRGDFHLTDNSPCINSGANSAAPGVADRDGRPRVTRTKVDLGAYEFQWPELATFRSWLAAHGLASDGSSDTSDADGDGMNNWQEWVAGTDPTDRLSLLKVAQPVRSGGNVVLTWQSVAGRLYQVLRCSTPAGQDSFQIIAADVVGQPGQTTFTDPQPSPDGPVFYRVVARQ